MEYVVYHSLLGICARLSELIIFIIICKNHLKLQFIPNNREKKAILQVLPYHR